jgi:K+-sensing histidine kinase KdpD
VLARPEGDLLVETPKESYPELLSLAVHELRGPAGVVIGYLRMLQRDMNGSLTDQQRKMIDEAAKSCARLNAVVEELSDVGKIDGGRIRLKREPTDAFSLVAEVANLVHEASDRGVRLEVRGAAAGATLSGDQGLLRRAFDAIFRAILREKPRQCTVVAERRIETIDGSPWAIVIVADESSVQAAYDRTPGPFDDRRGGLGLALPLARRAINGHGGQLWSPASMTGAPVAEGAPSSDPLARGSAIISLPITELPR